MALSGTSLVVRGNAARSDVTRCSCKPFLAYTHQSLWTSHSAVGIDRELESVRSEMDRSDHVLFAKLSSSACPGQLSDRFRRVRVHPDTGPDWKIRAALVILLPRRK